MELELDGSVRIAWSADGFGSIRVFAPLRTRRELDAFARAVADAALTDRTATDLRSRLREQFPGDFDLQARPYVREGETPFIVVTLRPPRREGTPEPEE